MDVGPAELLIVLLIALLVFGGAKLPKLARSIGEAAKEFRAGIDEGARSTSDDAEESKTDAAGSTKADAQSKIDAEPKIDAERAEA
jgi:sec-independent protein translocase protein TatA